MSSSDRGLRPVNDDLLPRRWRRRIIVFQGVDGLWYWHVQTRNGEVIAHGEGYTRRNTALRGARRAHPDIEHVYYAENLAR